MFCVCVVWAVDHDDDDDDDVVSVELEIERIDVQTDPQSINLSPEERAEANGTDTMAASSEKELYSYSDKHLVKSIASGYVYMK